MDSDEIQKYLTYGMDLAMLGLRIYDAAQAGDETALATYRQEVADRVMAADQKWRDAGG